MLSDFSTLTDLRDFESTLDLVLLTSISSEIVLSLRSAGVRERFLEEEELLDDLIMGGPISLLRLERDRTVAGEGDMERRLLAEREERIGRFSSRVR
ncbi:hypothetical protein CVS40_3658 [Lucilia cuprina]|nr:hypothetical protein CVS40_3659 [Lucilia cuprina]KAI8126331.1 hypothetical protein CVS40_3658 [Lucilia cuprina]